MSGILLGRTNEDSQAFFRRRTGHSLEQGAVVLYELRGGRPFSIVAHREGVELSGTFPCVAREGVLALKQMLDRAVRHHEHLKSFAVGQRQTILDEEMLEKEEEGQAVSMPGSVM